MNLKNINRPTLLVIAGPTAVGKTQYAIDLAQQFQTAIISADSRQFFKEMKIGTAAPTQQELELVPHFFVGNLSIHDYYSASRFEQDVLKLLPSLFVHHPLVLMCGGSGMYIDAVCHGIDDIPDPDPDIRNFVTCTFQNDGIESLRKLLQKMDKDFYNTCNLADAKRMMRAVEVSMQTGQPYSNFLIQRKKKRDFDIIKICFTRPREILFDRINRRVELMISQGWLQEAEQLFPYRSLNSLNTVGYKELFDYMEGKLSLEQALTDIKTHTRRYAKRQMTWFQRDDSYQFEMLT